ncbi:hypothetical protein ACPC54_37975 [Kitasatospora sp. NPDC094028]
MERVALIVILAIYAVTGIRYYRTPRGRGRPRHLFNGASDRLSALALG